MEERNKESLASKRVERNAFHLLSSNVCHNNVNFQFTNEFMVFFFSLARSLFLLHFRGALLPQLEQKQIIFLCCRNEICFNA